jgi:hypothetical protein
MEGIIDRIIREWKTSQGIESDHSDLTIKYHDHELGIYTIYFNIENTTTRLKAIRVTPDTLLNKLKKAFGLHQSFILKITNMS